ncbi:uncharacterized protein PG986_005904 [Apiospora aurea]|uniref:Rhodopsin domain-containing protein n=1 Tax=Apiospora aurea TaxID=335848 RepID=A0ABR1QJQ3_9PEZI
MTSVPTHNDGPVLGSDVSEDKGPRTLITIWIVTGTAIIFTTGRLYVRGYMQRRLRSDDYLTMFSMINSVLACGLGTKAISRGLGRHISSLSPEDKSAATVWTFAAFFPGLLSFAVPKLAVIALLVRLLLPSRCHFWFLWFMGVAVQLAQFGTMGLLIRDLAENCKLFDSVDNQKERGKCIPMHIQVRYYLFAASLSAFADFYLAAYPSIVLYQLQMPGRKKFALSVALGCGVVVEGGIIVIASSIPILQPLIDKLVGTRIMGRSRTYFTKHIAIFSDRRKIATTVRRRIRKNQAMTTTTNFTTTTPPEELSPVHRMDSGIDDPEKGAKSRIGRIVVVQVTEDGDDNEDGPTAGSVPGLAAAIDATPTEKTAK